MQKPSKKLMFWMFRLWLTLLLSSSRSVHQKLFVKSTHIRFSRTVLNITFLCKRLRVVRDSTFHRTHLRSVLQMQHCSDHTESSIYQSINLSIMPLRLAFKYGLCIRKKNKLCAANNAWLFLKKNTRKQKCDTGNGMSTYPIYNDH